MTQLPVLVTGANGMVGSHLIKLLVEKGLPVRALIRPGADLALWHKFWPKKQGNWPFEIMEGDVLDFYDQEKAVLGVESVFHTAGMISFYQKDHKRMLLVNGKATGDLVNTLLAVNPKAWLCHLSSIAALGRSHKAETIDESRIWKKDPANTGYAISKYAGEREVWRGIEEGLHAVILNPSVILGELAHWEQGTGALFSRVQKGLPFAPPGSTGFVDVQDLTQLMINLWQLKIERKRFVANAANLSWMELFTLIAKALHKNPPRSKLPPLALTCAPAFAWMPGMPNLSKEICRNSIQNNRYLSKKVNQELQFSFQPIEQTIERVAKAFENDLSNPF